jgi:hypothetical protein
MIERVLIASCLIVTLASLSLLGLVWHQSNQAVNAAADATRRSAEAQAANQAKMVELLTQSQSANAEILKQLQTMTKAGQSSQSPDAVPVSFKLTLETPEGPPAVRYEVTLQRGSRSWFEPAVICRESDAAGLVDFGLIYPGDREFAIRRSRDDDGTWLCGGNINVPPGTKLIKSIVCPSPRPVPSMVKLRILWPADRAEKNLCTLANFVAGPTTIRAPLQWTALDSDGHERRQQILAGPGLKQTEISGATKLDLRHFFQSKSKLSVQRVFGDFHSPRVPSRSDAVAMDPGSFFPRRLIVLRPCRRQNPAVKDERFEVLAHTEAAHELGLQVSVYSNDPDLGEDPFPTSSTLRDFKGGVTVAPSYWHELEGRFLVRPGQVNEWTLSLPEELINTVREELAGQDAPRAEQPAPSSIPAGASR